jgi:hypothetical protein
MTGLGFIIWKKINLLACVFCSCTARSSLTFPVMDWETWRSLNELTGHHACCLPLLFSFFLLALCSRRLVVHLRPTNRLSQEDPIILPVNGSPAASKFSPRDLTSSQAKLVVLESTEWDVHSSERKPLLHKLVMEELSFPYFWNHGVHKQLLYVLFRILDLASNNGTLTPLPLTSMKLRTSLYADNAAIFIAPQTGRFTGS